MFNGFQYARTLDELLKSGEEIKNAYKDYSICNFDQATFSQALSLHENFFTKSTGMSVEHLKERFKHCPTAFKCILKKNQGFNTSEVVGYFVALPITKQCVDRILHDEIEAGRHIRVRHIARNFSKPFSSIYISAVCGKTFRDQAVTTIFLIDFLKTIFEKKKISQLFVRPTTPEGRAAFKTLSGRECRKDEKIEMVNLSINQINNSLEKKREKIINKLPNGESKSSINLLRNLNPIKSF
jgi:hypothetical protein